MKISDILTEAPLYFYGSRCTVDCGGHKAGYEWARRKPQNSCDSQSPSFTKGCQIAHQHMDANKEQVLAIGTRVSDNSTGDVYVWRGVQWVNQATGRVASRDVAKELSDRFGK